MGEVLFQIENTQLQHLLGKVKTGELGLPDLQRPFVWQNNKVRDLLDSMMKGYPIGFVMVWHTSNLNDYNSKNIGYDDKVYKIPREVIIDGQQRLTSLFSAIYGIKIFDKNYQEREIEISFNPLIRKFEVPDATIRRNKEFISKISDLFFAKENNRSSKFIDEYIAALNKDRSDKQSELLTDDEIEIIRTNFNDLLNLQKYSLPSISINSDASEEDVSQIFVRVNSGGQKLNENDFILTLLSVYAKELRDKIDVFCQEARIPKQGTSYNNLIQVDPSHVVRMAIGYGFKRARLRYAYMLLRGKDLLTGQITEDYRNENLNKFKESLDVVLNLNNWHGFLNVLVEIGYVSEKIIASEIAVVFSYTMYLIAKYDYKLDSVSLRKYISKWFFMVALTSMYNKSTETTVEKIYNDLKQIKTADEFKNYIDEQCSIRLTEDYFNVTLPKELETSAAISPSWYAYLASQNILHYPILFGNVPVSNYLLPGSSGSKNAIDKHHIFPKHYLETIGIKEDIFRNQIANFTYIDYVNNIEISDNEPKAYIAKMKTRFGQEEFDKYCEQHALPNDFENMEYFEFLQERRKLMAQIIKKAYLKLCNQ